MASARAFGGQLCGGKGARSRADAVEDGPEAYTPYQYLYISHDDFRLMNLDPDAKGAKGRLRIRRSSGDDLSVIPFFDWEYPTASGWMPIGLTEETEEQLGMRELSLVSDLTGIVPIGGMGWGIKPSRCRPSPTTTGGFVGG